MSDERAIEIAKKYGLPIVHVPDNMLREIITVNLMDRNRPKITKADIAASISSPKDSA